MKNLVSSMGKKYFFQFSPVPQANQRPSLEWLPVQLIPKWTSHASQERRQGFKIFCAVSLSC